MKILPNAIDQDFKTLTFERDGHLLRVTLDHPPFNTVDDELHTEICRLAALLKDETEARAVLLTGAGKVFCGGAHFDWLPTLQGAQRLDLLRRHAKQLMWDFLDIEIPVIAAVHGAAMGFGASLALMCDVIYMAESAVMADPHVQIGVVAGDGGTTLWPMAMGPHRAKEYLWTGGQLTAADAERLGLVNHVVPDDELFEQAAAFAHRIANGPPLPIRATKVCINKLIKNTINTSFDTAIAWEMLTFCSEDKDEAVAAWKEKRAGVFHGR